MLKTHGTTTKSYLTFTQKIELQLLVRASVSHVIPVKKNKENDFSMEFSTSSKSREIDRSEGFHRIRSIFGAAFNVASHADGFMGACFSSLVGRDEKTNSPKNACVGAYFRRDIAPIPLDLSPFAV